MAAGDSTVTAASLEVSGTKFRISGTAEVDNTIRAFDVLPGRTITKLEIDGNTDGGAIVKSSPNVNASGTADIGNMALQSGIDAVTTVRWTAEFI